MDDSDKRLIQTWCQRTDVLLLVVVVDKMQMNLIHGLDFREI